MTNFEAALWLANRRAGATGRRQRVKKDRRGNKWTVGQVEVPKTTSGNFKERCDA